MRRLIFAFYTLAVALAAQWTAFDEHSNSVRSIESFEFKPPSQSRLIVVFLVCGVHAREVITELACRRLVEYLQTNADRLRYVHVIVVPLLNVDGVERQEQDACWRGNARGVDLNRNWKRLPNVTVPTQHKDEEYAGEQEMSEWEVRALDDALRHYHPDILLTVHSGTFALLLPFDSFAFRPRNYANMVRIAKWLRNDVCDQCTVAQGSRALYRSVGTLMDYAHWYLHVPLVYTLEMYGSYLSSEQSTCDQYFNPPAQAREAFAQAWVQGMFSRLLFIHNNQTALDLLDIIEHG